jgi:hypothetical protein
MNLGVDGFNRWSFLNRGDLDGQWQMLRTWDDVGQRLLGEFKPMPVPYRFYGLISRFTAKHSTVLSSAVRGGLVDGFPRVFTAAVRSPRGNVSWFVLNDAPRPWRATLRLEGGGGAGLHAYEPSSRDAEPDPMAIGPARQIAAATLRAGLDVELAPQSLTVYSSFRLAPKARGIFADAPVRP